MKRRKVEIDIKQAKELYNSDNAVLRKIALQAYTEKECTGFDYSGIKTFEDALDVLDINGFERKQLFNMVDNNISNYSRASAAMFKLNIIRKALNTGYNMYLTKDIDDQNYIWHPYFRFTTKDCTYYDSELEHGVFEKIGKITSEGITYDVFSGCTHDGCATGLGYFDYYNGVGYANALVGFLGCATEEIARHFGEYFGMLIMEAMYGDMVDFEIIK